MSYRIGLGDWFAPDCQPGSAGCVPHWYCYVPGMATPDCLASLTVGMETLGGDVGSAVGGTVGAVVSGATSAAGAAAGKAVGGLSSSALLIGGAILIGAVVLLVVVKG